MYKCMNHQLIVRITGLAAASLLLLSCGSGSDPQADVEPVDNSNEVVVSEPPLLDPAEQVALDPQQADLLDQLDTNTIGGDNTDTELAEDNGDLIPLIFPTETGLDLSYAQAGAALVEQLNETLILPRDIDVNFADCGTANAFYVPAAIGSEAEGGAGGSIFMCHELSQLFLDLYGDSERAFLSSAFVLMHELGHALIDQLEVPIIGLEEAAADSIGAVFVGEAGLAEGAVLAGWFFFSQPETPFFDTHRAGPQRLGDLACLGVGADPTLLDDPTIANIAAQLVQGGRNCPQDYAIQLDNVSLVFAPYIRGGLGDALGSVSTFIVGDSQP